MKQRLLTNSERARRGLGQNSECLLCGQDSENLLHVLRDCLITKEAWMLIVPTEKISRFFLILFKLDFPLIFVVMIRCRIGESLGHAYLG